MAQSGYTPIQLYYSTTAAATPTAGNLANGELALNIQDEKLYFKNASGTVKLLASNAASATSGTSILYGNGSGGFSNVTIGSGISFAGGTLSATGSGGTVTSVALSGGTTGLTVSGSPITTSGTITLAGTLATTNGGTGLTSFTANGVMYASSTSALTTGSALTFDGTTFAVGGAATGGSYKLQSYGASGNIGISIVNGGNAAGDFDGLEFMQGAAQKAVIYTNSNNLTTNVKAGSNIFQLADVEQMRLTSTGLGIGTSSPGAKLDVSGNAIISDNSSNAALRITQTGAGNALVVEDSANPDSTPFVIDQAGRVFVGATSGYSTGGLNPGVQVNGTGGISGFGSYNWSSTGSEFASLNLSRSMSNTVGTQSAVTVDQAIGIINFNGSDGTGFIRAAQIIGNVDGTPGTNDMPGRLVFSTTADGASSPTERMRIDNAGNVGIGVAPVANNGILQLNSYASVQAMMEKATVSATAATGTINFDAATQPVLYYTTNASGNWTINIRGNSGLTLNSMMQTGQSLTLAFLATNGSTAYYQSALTIDGSSVTPKWQGGTAPTAGNASSIDAYVLTVIKTGSATFTVLASQTKFA